jgi:tRNA A-37 threonylcarbamoyl transferase component Bud32
MLTPDQARRLESDLFEDGEGNAPPGAVEGEPRPERIGRYRILRVIGSGGMGTVYEAEQESPRRLAALKVLRTGVASRTAMRRFEHEVAVLAHLHHPGIAQIYEAGRYDSGAGAVPYFAMEYVRNATPITRYAEERRLSLRERLRLFADVCDAVHHGHQKGVIHRDLKPENILVGADQEAATHRDSPPIKVIDFGIARATDSDLAVTTIHTDYRSLIGTLQYMSPEQSDLGPEGTGHALDIRSDVYALGVVLYELLTGRVPYDVSHKSFATAIRMIQDADPQPPSRFRRALRGDADAIVLKAIQKDPDKRYPSAADLAQDIRRCLSGEPTEARHPTAWARAMRRVARHPILTTAAACLVIGAGTLALTALTVWWYARRPHDLVVSPDANEARLVSAGGHILHVWPTATRGGIRFAAMIPRPQALGGGRLVVIGFYTSNDPGLAGRVCAFDPDGDLDVPLWTGALEEGDLPEPVSGTMKAEEFVVFDGAVLDVFPERPGPEIVVPHVHAESACALRIYDLSGHVLFQVWHDGHLRSPVWLPQAGKLVLTGLNTAAYWHQRGAPEHDVGLHPKILLAFRPQPGQRLTEWLETPDGRGTYPVEWYRALLLSEHGDIATILELRAAQPADGNGADFVAIILIRDNEDLGFSVPFDAFGHEVGTRQPSNGYRAKRGVGEVPPMGVFRFGPLPPILHELEDVSSAPRDAP